MQVSVPLVLHGQLKTAVEDPVEGADPVLHLALGVCGQNIAALVLHLQLERKPPHTIVLHAKKN